MRIIHVLPARLLLILALSFATVAAAAPALAQETGGSFGGGDWGGGGDSDWGGGGSDWGGSSGGGSDFGAFSGGGGCSGDPMGLVCSLVLLVLVSVVIAFVKNRQANAGRALLDHGGVYRPAAPASNRIDMAAVMLAVDWRARAFLQGQLDKLARSGDTNTPGGRARLLHETVVALRRCELGWLYAGGVNADPADGQVIQPRFQAIAQESRTRFKRELIRSHDGTTTEEATPEMRARADEGRGVVVITLVVAARGEIPDVASFQDARQLANLMRNLGAIPATSLVAIEVIWSPAAENDRMSTAELEVLYPELKRIDERSIAGRIFCPYCGGPYAAELLRCSHCGAPAPQAAPPASA